MTVTDRPSTPGLAELVKYVAVLNGTTDTVTDGLVELSIDPLPVYTAVIAFDPSASDVVVNEAEPAAETPTVISTWFPCTKLTDPDDTGAVLVLTEAVKVTGRPG